MSKILVIDDDNDLRSLLEIFFISAGHHATGAANGALGLVAVSREMPDVVILDIDMPVLDGLDTLKTLKADRFTRHIPVVILTSYDQAENHDRASLSGATAFYGKPVDLPELMVCVDRVISDGPEAAQEREPTASTPHQ